MKLDNDHIATEVVFQSRNLWHKVSETWENDFWWVGRAFVAMSSFGSSSMIHLDMTMEAEYI